MPLCPSAEHANAVLYTTPRSELNNVLILRPWPDENLNWQASYE